MPGEGNTEGSRGSRGPVTTPGSVLGWRLLAESQIYGRHKTPVSQTRMQVDTKAYLTGYVDGEGCFCVTFNRSKRHAMGWDIRPSFSVSQNQDRAEILFMLQEILGCGSIRPDRSDRTLKYEVRSVPELIGKIIPHFEAYPLLSSKAREFEAFAEICRMMFRKDHLTPAGFDKIAELSAGLNASGKKRYPRSEIKV